jgi:CheY-like chemotaxis protein
VTAGIVHFSDKANTREIAVRTFVPKSTPKSVMIVDDNEIIRRCLRNLFKKSDEWAVCAEAENGRDALHKAHIHHPEFIVLDFCMPAMDGLEVAPKLRHQPRIVNCDADRLQGQMYRAESLQGRH